MKPIEEKYDRNRCTRFQVKSKQKHVRKRYRQINIQTDIVVSCFGFSVA